MSYVYPIDGDTTQSVESMSRKKIHGFIIPTSWAYHLLTPAGNTYPVAELILGRIVNYYQPVWIADTDTGMERLYKKFAGDQLQWGPGQIASVIGLDVKTVRRALKYLVDLELIRYEVRPIAIINGKTCSNVPYIDIWPEAIAIISSPTSLKETRWCHRYNAPAVNDPLPEEDDHATGYRVLLGEYASALAAICRQRINFGSSVVRDIENEQRIFKLAASIVSDYHDKAHGGETVTPDSLARIWERYWEGEKQRREGNKAWLGDIENDLESAMRGKEAAMSLENADGFGEYQEL